MTEGLRKSVEEQRARIGLRASEFDPATGLQAGVNKIRNLQNSAAVERRDHQLEQIRLDREAAVVQQKNALEVLRNEKKIAIEKLRGLELEGELGDKRHTAALQSIIDEKNLAIARGETSVLQAELAAKNAATAIQNFEKMNAVLKNDGLAILNDFSKSIKERLRGSVDDLFTAIENGTLTMDNFKQGVKDLFKGILSDLGKNVFDKLVMKPLEKEIDKLNTRGH